ncbi:MAG: type II toxin-antitoxin system prevent-host-death family antitoxin [Sandaracinaceae bacterium]|nr:type II toxin-antitoxin system prevent-host-death family antitoxin [Sandaracinaceae bacterium]
MSGKRQSVGAEEARARLPDLLERAHHGKSTLITKRGRPYAVLAPVPEARVRARVSILALKGSGAGLWGSSASETVAAMRDEWG